MTKRFLLTVSLFILGIGCATAPAPHPESLRYAFTDHGYSLFKETPPAPEPIAKVDPCALDQTHTPDQCPWLDDDRDSIANGEDACPTEKGIPELKGCPALDADHDGVPDYLDQCVNEAGLASNEGCPVRKAEMTATHIELKEAVYFDTNRATLQGRSDELLRDIAALLKSNPQVSKVLIEGHTDSRGAVDWNRKLSEARAEAVKARLVEEGIPAVRLEPRGYGPDRPIQTNKTSKGRAANRRVEFNFPAAKE